MGVTIVYADPIPGPQGPAGPQGPPGSGGGGSAGYDHVQAISSDEWTINHNLGYKPSVEIFSAGGSEIEAEVVHTSLNQVKIYFTISITGSARLN